MGDGAQRTRPLFAHRDLQRCAYRELLMPATRQIVIQTRFDCMARVSLNRCVSRIDDSLKAFVCGISESRLIGPRAHMNALAPMATSHLPVIANAGGSPVVARGERFPTITARARVTCEWFLAILINGDTLRCGS